MPTKTDRKPRKEPLEIDEKAIIRLKARIAQLVETRTLDAVNANSPVKAYEAISLEAKKAKEALNTVLNFLAGPDTPPDPELSDD